MFILNNIIYLDHAATTATNPEVVLEMMPYFTQMYGNPSSIYGFSQKPKDAIEKARNILGKTINAKPECIYFTAGGSESDNWALKGIAKMYSHKGRHIITSKIEHHAILNTCKYLENNGFKVSYIDVDENGIIKMDELKKAIRRDTILISVMYANNEIGTIQPISEIGRIAREHNIIFHTDAVQAYGHLKIDVKKENIDMLSVSGHKFNGPKGIGFLYIDDRLKIGSFIHGGAQERKLRAGTENVPGIVGIGKAAEIADNSLLLRSEKETALRNYTINRILREIPYCRLNGSLKDRLPNNMNFSFQFVDGSAMIVMLDMYGICCSGGSACTSGDVNASHVLMALGMPEDIARGTIRMTIGHENTKKQMDFVIEKMKSVVARLRDESPVYTDYKKIAMGVGR